MAETFDVLVVGGGPAGITAALQAARLGRCVCLVEKTGVLGGTITNGGVNAIQTFFAYGKPIIAGIGWELVCRCAKVLGRPEPDGREFNPRSGVTNTVVDRFVFPAVVDEAMLEAKVDLRLHTMLGAASFGGDSWRVTLCGKEGLYQVGVRVVVDCSGDANAFALAGLPLNVLSERQPGTLVVRLDGYDPSKLDMAALQAAFDTEVAAGRLRKSDTGWFHGSVEPLLRGRGGNCVHVINDSAADSRGKTQAELEGRRVVLGLLKFLRTQPGLENLVVSSMAGECGIRETVTIVGRAMVTGEDYLAGRVFVDAVCCSFYPIDVHLNDGLDFRPLPQGTVPTIPFGSMLPVEGRQIIAAGRCVCGDRIAFSAYRVQATCMAIGQAAGAAAALSVAKRCDVAEVPLSELRTTLREHGAIVPGE